MTWIPFDERVVFELSPISKKPGQHSEQAAYLSLSLDLRNDTIKGLREYARIWKWHYAAVERFFKKIGYRAGQNLQDVARQKRDKAETLIALTNSELGLGVETKARQSRDTTIKEVEKDKNIYAAFFDNFWKNYPTRNGRKVGKKECAAYVVEKKKINPEQFDEVLTATKNYSREAGKYAKDPIRFLKNDFWRDYITGPSNGRMVI